MLTWLCDSADVSDALLVSHEAQHGEDDETGEDAGAAVCRREDHRVSAKKNGDVFGFSIRNVVASSWLSGI